MGEFELIQRYFQQSLQRADVVLGSGDDAAVTRVPQGHQLVITTDTLVDGIHFDQHIDAYSLGHKLLAVNLSDLAAMGATPAWVTVAMSAPQLSENWVKDFAAGFFALAELHQVALIGGDLTNGPSLSLTATCHGLVTNNQFLRQDTAQIAQGVFVTGTVGDAALALALQRGAQLDLSPDMRTACHQRLAQPTPRIAIGQALTGIASACIDISDGLYADLQRLLQHSGVGATVVANQLPLSAALQALAPSAAWHYACVGSEDFELCFTAPLTQQVAIQTIAQQTQTPITLIGQTQAEPGLHIVDNHQQALYFNDIGYEHQF